MRKATPPGFWIGVLGFLAATVTVFPDAVEGLGPLQRGGAVAVFFLLMVLEIRALISARAQQEEQSWNVLNGLAEIQRPTAAVISAQAELRSSEQPHHVSSDSLKRRALILADEILRWLLRNESRQQIVPRPAMWHSDTEAMLAQFREMMGEYSRLFGSRVIAMRNELATRGLQDPELELFYEHPTNPLGIRAVGERLGALAY